LSLLSDDDDDALTACASNDGDVPGIRATDSADTAIQPPRGDEEVGTQPEHAQRRGCGYVLFLGHT